MAYPGSKESATHVLAVLNDPAFDGWSYLEPFVGLGHILYRVQKKAKVRASDVTPDVVTILETIRDKGAFPRIEKSLFTALKGHDIVPAKDRQGFSLKVLRAFASIATFNGINWKHSDYSGTSPDQSRNYEISRNNYFAKLVESETIKRCALKVCSYTSYRPTGQLIYCDPPYKASAALNHRLYGLDGPFDTEKFWDVMRKWSVNNVVFVSESSAPDDFGIVASKHRKATFSASKKNNKTYVDSLYTLKAGLGKTFLQ